MEHEKLMQRANSLREHPRFMEAAIRANRDYLTWRAKLGVLNKLISNLARERILELVLFLHFTGEEEGGHGATFERLAASSEARDGVGSRAVRTALRLAQISGHVTLTRSMKDGRLRIYEPTDALLDQARGYYAIFLDALAELAPASVGRDRLGAEPGYLEGLLARVGRSYLAGGRGVGDKFDAFEAMLRLEGGRPILGTVVDCHLSGRELPAAPELARRYHISASQTRAVLKNAEARGLLEMAGRGRLSDAEPLVRAHLAAFTRTLAFLSLHVT